MWKMVAKTYIVPLCMEYCSKCFININPFKTCNNIKGLVLLLSPWFSRLRNRGLERLRNLLKVTQLVNGRTSIWSQQSDSRVCVLKPSYSATFILCLNSSNRIHSNTRSCWASSRERRRLKIPYISKLFFAWSRRREFCLSHSWRIFV